jgi:hypothetical protein
MTGLSGDEAWNYSKKKDQESSSVEGHLQPAFYSERPPASLSLKLGGLP